MNRILIALFLAVSLIAAPALAQKHGSAGNGKFPEEKKGVQKSVTQRKDRMADEVEKQSAKGQKARAENEKKLKKQRDVESRALEEKKESQKKLKKQREDELKGLEKQKAKKSEQVQKELDKGSEQGQEARSERRKWWRFWGE